MDTLTDLNPHLDMRNPKRWAWFSRTPWKRVAGAGATAAVIIGGLGYSVSRPDAPITPPSSGTTCLVSNYQTWAVGGRTCNAGATVTRTNQTWTCATSVAAVAAAAGGTPPVRVVINNTIVYGTGGGGMAEFLTGCTGDGNDDTIDFIIEMNGLNGYVGGIGGQADSLKFKTTGAGPTNIQLTGNFDCGPPGPGAHPDAIQHQTTTNRNLWIVNGKSGDYAAGLSSCQGAGGGPFWTSGSGYTYLGGEYILCNHALNANQAAGTNAVINVKFRAGRAEGWDGSPTGDPVNRQGGDPNCYRSPDDCRYWPTGDNVASNAACGGNALGTCGHRGCPYFTSPACTGTGNLSTFTPAVNGCQSWNPNTDTWQ